MSFGAVQKTFAKLSGIHWLQQKQLSNYKMDFAQVIHKKYLWWILLHDLLCCDNPTSHKFKYSLSMRTPPKIYLSNICSFRWKLPCPLLQQSTELLTALFTIKMLLMFSNTRVQYFLLRNKAFIRMKIK